MSLVVQRVTFNSCDVIKQPNQPLSNNSSALWECVETCPPAAVGVRVYNRPGVAAPGQKLARDEAVLELSSQRSERSQL